MKEHLKAVLTKMCEMVNADYDTIDFSKQERYYKYLWELQEQDEFKIWMVAYLMNNKEARQELLTHTIRNKQRVEKAVNEFVFNYGWKSNG